MIRRKSIISALALLLAAAGSAVTTAANRPPADVPPTMEIEILDPNADPMGRPAVELHRGIDGQLEVDIPPVVLVHKYYYTGDRSFQAQILPGGPTVVVASHPRTGERCYIDVQLMPGAPRVVYTAHSIEYDYGEYGITIHFGVFGGPKIKYRSGLQWHRKLGKLVHAEQCKEHAAELTNRAEVIVEHTKLVAVGAAAEVWDGAEMVVLPARNLLEMMPLGKIIFSSDLEQRLILRADEHRRETEIYHAEKEAELQELTRRTIR